MDTPPLIVIVGSTASGKSDLALYIADKFGGEIISADAMSVYKEFNIGTAKPSPEDRLKIVHHFVDVANPTEGYSAAVFKREAIKTISVISKKNKLPIMVGGSGLYVDSVLYDYSFMPPVNKNQRDYLNSLSISEILYLINKEKYDLTNIDIRNKRRLIRLYENKGQRPTFNSIRPNILIIGISLSKDALLKKINNRVNRMIDDGLIQEVEALSNKYGWECEPMKSIGYREFYEYFIGIKSIDEVKARIIKDTLELVKKQNTWFNRNKSIHWVENRDKVVELITTFLNK